MTTTRYSYVPSPLGDLIVTRDEVGITGLWLPTGKHTASYPPAVGWLRDDDAFDDIRTQLDEYFAGTRRAFDLPLNPHGSAFQKRVWRALLDIPYGETSSYGKQAASIGAPLSASRAVGTANGQNPISIVVPCHRVIGANGSLVGYGGGLPAKQWLLSHEAAHAGLFAL